MSVVADQESTALSRCGIDFDAVYNENVPLMIGVAVDRFHVSESDAQTLAHQVFLAFFLKFNDIRNRRAARDELAHDRAGGLPLRSDLFHHCEKLFFVHFLSLPYRSRA